MLFFTFFGHVFWAPIAVQRYRKPPGFGTESNKETLILGAEVVPKIVEKSSNLIGQVHLNLFVQELRQNKQSY